MGREVFVFLFAFLLIVIEVLVALGGICSTYLLSLFYPRNQRLLLFVSKQCLSSIFLVQIGFDFGSVLLANFVYFVLLIFLPIFCYPFEALIDLVKALEGVHYIVLRNHEQVTLDFRNG